MSDKISALVDKLGQLTIMEACELTKKLEEVWEIDMNNLAVSYTHLTLPTIYSV